MLRPVIELDMPLHFDAINPKFLTVLKQMGPFGPENQRPVFEASGIYVFNSLSSFKDKHVRFLAGQRKNDNIFQAVGFDLGEHYTRLSKGDEFKMAFTIEENTFNGITSIQLRIKDIKFH